MNLLEKKDLTAQIEAIEKNVVVTKLPESFDNRDLLLAFDPTNSDNIIFSCKVSKTFDEDGNVKSNKYGYVSFNETENADKAKK